MQPADGYLREVWAEREALRERCAERGMSAAAMSKIPPMPRIEETVLPPVVLATKAHGIRPMHQRAGKMRKFPSPVALEVHAKIKALPIERTHMPGGPGMKDESPGKTARIKAMTNVVATEAGYRGEQLMSYRTIRSAVIPKHVALYIVARLVEVSLPRLAELYGYKDHTSVRYAIQHAKHLLSTGHQAAIRLHNRSLEAIARRWPEYRSGGPA
ncbi:MAG: helix-turn-helix domain-containing protein [Pseudomonadota bacterium]